MKVCISMFMAVIRIMVMVVLMTLVMSMVMSVRMMVVAAEEMEMDVGAVRVAQSKPAGPEEHYSERQYDHAGDKPQVAVQLLLGEVMRG